MRIENRTKLITKSYNVYISNDGKEWPSEDACIKHEKRLNGDIIDCPECHGEGRIRGRFIEAYDNYDIGHVDAHYEYETCKKCKGKGYLEKKVSWE